MINTTDFIREFPIETRTDRDCEIPLVLEFIKSHPSKSLLDVGAHSSGEKYASVIRGMVKKYDGVDILSPMPKDAAILDKYYVGNAILLDLPIYDTVICISSIEHSGSSTYKAEDVKKEQEKLFQKILMLSSKYVWISFPTGLPYVFPNELSVIDEKQLKRWESLTKNHKVTERFLHNSAGPQAGTPWREHRIREAATKQQYWDYCGNQSITVLEIEKI